MGIATDKLVSLAPIILETIIKLLHPHMNLVEIAEEASPAIDKLIKKYKDQGLKFVGGTFKILLDNPDGFAVSYELFFQDNEDNWQKAYNTSKKMEADYYLTKEAWDTLKTNKIISYDIEEPTDISLKEN